MLLIRGFEDRVQRLFLRGEVYGTTHLYSGQEAVAVGFASALGPDDRVACTYRGHGHLLAMGTDPEALLAELLGRETGVNGGRAGSMNVVDPEHGVLGCYGIVGGSIAAATGAGLSLRGTGAVAVAYFGDGTTNQAYFFECLNFAKVFELPVVYVCENNGYGEYTPFEAVTPGGIVPRAAAMQLPTTELDGMDVRAVRAAAAEIVERVRGGGGPEFVEARTYRFVGHSRSDPGQVPARGRARPVARARPAGRRGGAAAGRARHERRTRSHRSPRRRGRARPDRGCRARGALPERDLAPGVPRRLDERPASDTRLVDIGMPRLSDSMEEATILSWLKRPGDDVARGEPLVEVETDKATMVYEAETDGVLEEIVVDDGSTARSARSSRGSASAAPAGRRPPVRHRPAATPAPACERGPADGRGRVPRGRAPGARRGARP